PHQSSSLYYIFVSILVHCLFLCFFIFAFFFFFFFFSSRRRHTRSVSAFLLNRSSDLFCVMEAIKLCRLDTPIIFIEARINLSRFVVTGCAAKTSATVTFPSLNLISLFAFCFNIWLNGVAS